MKQDIIYKYFFTLFSIIPISLLAGSAVSAINIILIAISFLIYSFYKKEWKWLKETNIKLLFIVYLYLIINSFISVDFYSGLSRNFGFIRFILFFAALNYFFYHYEKFNKIFIVWIVVIFISVVDVYFETFTGKNMLGYGSSHNRIESFFRDEQKIGGFIFCFYLLIIGYLLNYFKFKAKKYNYFILLFSILFVFSIILTGERSNSIKAIIALLIFFSLSNNFLFKEKVTLFVVTSVVFSLIYVNSEFVKLRFGKQLFWKVQSLNNYIDYFKHKLSDDADKDFPLERDVFLRSVGYKYFALSLSGYNVFKKYPYFGAGNKNYRVITCPKKTEDWNPDYICNSHPHQIYFEFLSEHGIIGTTILLVIFFTLIFKILRKVSIRYQYIQLGSMIYLALFFIPILPSGAFFNDYYLTLFFINLSLLYSCNKTTNIFNRSL